MPAPLCFILMPFGKKKDASGREIDFDAVYNSLIAPAVRDAGLEPLRADEEMTGGIIHKPMFERLVLCDYAVADLTTANANVFYELGVRHSLKKYGTVLVFASDGNLPFDVSPLRGIPYQLTPKGKPKAGGTFSATLTDRLNEARKASTDSPLFQLLEEFPDVKHAKTDVFRAVADYSAEMKERLAQARQQGIEAVRNIEAEIGKIVDCEAGVVIDLFLSYRAVKGWKEMIDLVPRMFPPLSQTVMVQEQLGFALNRAKRGEDAERVLKAVIKSFGPSSETYGILGRIYKDRWDAALQKGQIALAKGLLEQAVEAYLKGFQADWRDAYPGINAVTLMELKEPADPRRLEILPVVRYAVERRIASGTPDYWDFATMVELAVLAKDKTGAEKSLSRALAAVREGWEPETTAGNLRLIRESRKRRGERIPTWITKTERELHKAASPSNS